MRTFKKSAAIISAFLLVFLASCTLSKNIPAPPDAPPLQTVQPISPAPMPSPPATTKPSPSPAAGVLTFKGSGNSNITDVSLPFVVSILHFSHEGTGVFTVSDHFGKGERLLLNASGDFQGSTLIYGEEAHTITIESGGTWEIKIDTPLVVADTKCSGKGCGVSQMMFAGGNEEWAVTNMGKGDFIVYAYYTNGGGNKCTLAKKGDYSGTIKIKVPEVAMIIFTVVSEGEWTLERTKTEMKI